MITSNLATRPFYNERVVHLWLAIVFVLVVAATALAAGSEVSVWLTGESAWFALPGRAKEVALPHAAPLEELLSAVLAGGRVTLCTQCAARRDITEPDVMDGVRIAGASAFVEESLADGVQALVY